MKTHARLTCANDHEFKFFRLCLSLQTTDYVLELRTRISLANKWNRKRVCELKLYAENELWTLSFSIGQRASYTISIGFFFFIYFSLDTELVIWIIGRLKFAGQKQHNVYSMISCIDSTVACRHNTRHNRPCKFRSIEIKLSDRWKLNDGIFRTIRLKSKQKNIIN